MPQGSSSTVLADWKHTGKITLPNRDLPTLIDLIAAGNPNPHRGNPVMEITLWDGRVVTARYHDCEVADEDVTSRSDVIHDIPKLRGFVERLLAHGTPFVTGTGSHDLVCVLQYTIRDAA